jgi:hypothetical protein
VAIIAAVGLFHCQCDGCTNVLLLILDQDVGEVGIARMSGVGTDGHMRADKRQ